MAQFRVGQRVRVVAQIPTSPIYIGLEGVVSAVCVSENRPGDHRVCLNNPPDGEPGDGYYFLSEELAPLTDPLADAFIERIKKLQPLKEPVDA